MMILSNKLYDAFKWVALICLPSVEALWLTLGTIWTFPYVTEVGATIAALSIFLGALLGVSNHQYKKQDATNDAPSGSVDDSDADTNN